MAAQQASEDALSVVTCGADETPGGQINMSLRQDCVELRNALAMHVGIYACQALAHFWPDGRSVLQDNVMACYPYMNVYIMCTYISWPCTMTVLHLVHIGLQLRYGIMVLYNVALSASEEDSSPRSMPGSMAPWATEAVAAPRASCVLCFHK